jgi:ribosomal protein S18 acetylase RimI-like enzyme
VTGDNVAHLLKICLCPPYRGTEISKGFWISLLNELKQLGMSSVYLEVESTKLRAIKFYKKNNFEQLRVIKGFYSSGGDALTMNLTLVV